MTRLIIKGTQGFIRCLFEATSLATLNKQILFPEAAAAKPCLRECVAVLSLPRSDPTTDDLKSRVEFAGGTTVIRVK